MRNILTDILRSVLTDRQTPLRLISYPVFKDVAALENEEPAFRLFTDVFSRFIIHGTVTPSPQGTPGPGPGPAVELSEDPYKRSDDYVAKPRRVTFKEETREKVLKRLWPVLSGLSSYLVKLH